MNGSATCPAQDPWLAHSVRIQQVIQETPGVATYNLAFDDPVVGERFRYRPGQFCMIYLPGLGEIAVSISGNPARTDVVPHTIRVAGRVTQALADLEEGAGIGLRGPFGSVWPTDRCAGRDVILAAGGIGLAPLRPVIYDILADRDRYGAVTLLYGCRLPSGLLYTSEYQKWRAGGIAVKTTVDRAEDDWGGNVGVVTVLLDRLSLARPSETVLMTCGPEVMMWYTIQAALDRGLNADSVFLSMERNMNCAIGLCGHCQFGSDFVCKDGPVLPYERVASILRVDDL
ncbi:MAG: FAD/NAD(P)-binding protein [Fuerstiella sp.]